MYYKVTNKKSDIYKAIDGLVKDINATRKSNAKKLQEFTGIKFKQFSLSSSIFSLVGRIEAIIPTDKNFEMTPDWIEDKEAGVKGAIKPHHKTKLGKATRKFIKELPDKTLWDMHKVFNIKSDVLSHPGIQYGKNDVIIIEFGDKLRNVKPLPGMIEIKTSEFYKLQGK